MCHNFDVSGRNRSKYLRKGQTLSKFGRCRSNLSIQSQNWSELCQFSVVKCENWLKLKATDERTEEKKNR